MFEHKLTRRAVLASTAGMSLASMLQADEMVTPSGETIVTYNPETADFPFEVQRSEAEWRAHLGDDDDAYEVLRRAKTEQPKTTDLWKEAHAGGYECRGCGLKVYDGAWFEPLDKGWVFFHHAEAHAVMFATDGPVPQYGQGPNNAPRFGLTEIHCRRCGSHLGHHLRLSGMQLHCINGTSLSLA